MLCAPLASVILRNFGEVTRQTWPWPGNNYLQPRLVAFALLAIKTLIYLKSPFGRLNSCSLSTSGKDLTIRRYADTSFGDLQLIRRGLERTGVFRTDLLLTFTNRLPLARVQGRINASPSHGGHSILVTCSPPSWILRHSSSPLLWHVLTAATGMSSAMETYRGVQGARPPTYPVIFSLPAAAADQGLARPSQTSKA